MKRLYHTRDVSVAIGARGLLIDSGYSGLLVQPDHLKGVKRGKITGFSYASAKRLRRALMTAYVPGCKPWGITLTVPLTVDDWQSDWLSTCQRFWVACRRLEGFIGAIWRAELQQRGMPHLHCVVWVRTEIDLHLVQEAWRQSLASWSVSPSQSAKRCLNGEWVEILCKSQADGFVDSSFAGMSKTTTCHIDALEGSSASVRYLCDHTSKRKQAQLGYQGRQWGIVNRARLSWLDDGLSLTDRQVVFLLRLLRCWSRGWYRGTYRGRLSHARLNGGRFEVWADDRLRARILAWLAVDAEAPTSGTAGNSGEGFTAAPRGRTGGAPAAGQVSPFSTGIAGVAHSSERA